MLYLLEQAGLLTLLIRETKRLKHLPKPDKLYLGDYNLMFALSPRVDTGTLRKTFFSQQLQVENELILPSALDDIEIGNHNRSPLWLFGFLY